MVNAGPTGIFALRNDTADDPLWRRMCGEVQDMAAEEPALRRYYRNTILQYDSLDCALVHHLSNKLANDSVGSGEWYKLLEGVLREPCGGKLVELMRADLQAIMTRDPACEGAAHALLNYKGYLGLQASRVAHELWLRKRRSLALAIQSRVSEIFGMDIHPACRIGRGVMIDHATGVVFGETAVIGDDCTILHGVTLGGTGKDRGDRHPKLGCGILIGAGALILGNIRIGDGCKIAAGSVVLMSLPAHTTAAGVPAKIVGRAMEDKPGCEVDQSLSNVSFFDPRALRARAAGGSGGGAVASAVAAAAKGARRDAMRVSQAAEARGAAEEAAEGGGQAKGAEPVAAAAAADARQEQQQQQRPRPQQHPLRSFM